MNILTSSTRLAICLLALSTAHAGAQDHNKPAITQAAPELAALKRLEGTWACKGAVAAGEFGPGTPAFSYTSTATIEPLYDGNAYVMAYVRDDAPGAPFTFSGSWFVGWDGVKQQLSYFWLDSVGTVALQAGGAWQDNLLTLNGEGSVRVPSGPDTFSYRKAVFRDSHQLEDDGRMHWKGEMQVDGSNDWIVLGKDDCTRQ